MALCAAPQSGTRARAELTLSTSSPDITLAADIPFPDDEVVQPVLVVKQAAHAGGIDLPINKSIAILGFNPDLIDDRDWSFPGDRSDKEASLDLGEEEGFLSPAAAGTREGVLPSLPRFPRSLLTFLLSFRKGRLSSLANRRERTKHVKLTSPFTSRNSTTTCFRETWEERTSSARRTSATTNPFSATETRCVCSLPFLNIC